MKYLKLAKHVVIIQDIKTVCRDKILHNEKWYEIVQIDYLDGHKLQLPFDTEEDSIKAFDEIALSLLK
jgi:hypothetical protein